MRSKTDIILSVLDSMSHEQIKKALAHIDEDIFGPVLLRTCSAESIDLFLDESYPLTFLHLKSMIENQNLTDTQLLAVLELLNKTASYQNKRIWPDQFVSLVGPRVQRITNKNALDEALKYKNILMYAAANPLAEDVHGEAFLEKSSTNEHLTIDHIYNIYNLIVLYLPRFKTKFVDLLCANPKFSKSFILTVEAKYEELNGVLNSEDIDKIASNIKNNDFLNLAFFLKNSSEEILIQSISRIKWYSVTNWNRLIPLLMRHPLSSIKSCTMLFKTILELKFTLNDIATYLTELIKTDFYPELRQHVKSELSNQQLLSRLPYEIVLQFFDNKEQLDNYIVAEKLGN